MRALKADIADGADAKARYKSAPAFAPAGQSTQMIVGADAATDAAIVSRAATLYDRFRLRRVYYSAFSLIPDASAVLPLVRPPLMREHRLYQADWMMRFYGFSAREVAGAAEEGGNLPLDIDPKLAWALKHRDIFPLDVNRASRELLLRVPGLGTKAVDRIIAARAHRRLRLDDVGRITRSVAKLRPFLVAADWRPVRLADAVLPRPSAATEQLELFGGG
jgi:predicted DNA-binding helix-hairpin-helix protein